MIYNFKQHFKILLLIMVVCNFIRCYSFTGASVPVHLSSIAIPVVDDKSSFVEAGLKEDFTNKLIQKFLDDNTLQVTEKANADAILECTILSVTDSPVAVSAEENVSAKRITITVRAVFKDLVKKQIISDKKYSYYSDYNTTDFTAGRNAAFQTAVDLVVDEILLGTVSNW